MAGATHGLWASLVAVIAFVCVALTQVLANRAGFTGPQALVVLAVGTWLRPVSYAYWAGCVSAALALTE